MIKEGVHFVTFTVVGWLDVFIRKAYKEINVESLNYCVKEKGLKVYAWCLMTSHLHLIISTKEGVKLSGVIRDFKKHTAKSVIGAIKEMPESRREWLLWFFERAGKKDARTSRYKFWKEDNHAIQLYSGETIISEQKLDYVHNNPVEEGVVESPEEYLYSSARDYAGITGLVDIEFME